MKQFLAVIGFSLLTIAGFAGFSNFGIPRIEPAPPPVQEKIDLGAMTMDQFIALGDRVLNGKGTCKLCHNELGRAPMLEQIIPNTKERLADARYEGEANDLAGYIIESMIKPSAYVVAGFGKAGSGDTISPMPDVSGGSIGLLEAELLAVVAFLQDSGGAEVTVEIPTDAGDAEEEEAEVEEREPLEDPIEIAAEFGCGTCHIIGEDEGDLGPDLSKIGATRDREYLRRAILYPNAEIAEGFEEDIMPDDLGDVMFAVEIERLTEYLSGLK
ncbi:MAG: hypothetical protein HOL66_12800 [Rhodospirillaceae bacterium]|jgi:hypothetical protein|nr:hypothetical protein [Rhodospirillaceae bacterium]MBT5245110.1 hypothetical protein [Rhodospirillaceae bacterium]MBT5562025.1 hypothetical protein [Rhodospirillaceae bacterium]MBT6242198.1 hypothetical protein [Rhodospirillaceae bacterium]MBT7136667.1 hypothetical protein [Rhodospirillaceae bacterium]